MRRFVIGDIHGAYKALKQCLKKSGFNYDEDLLISLGDACDGWPETRQCLDELLKIKNLIIVLGNHDQWALTWMKTGNPPVGWLSQGGQQTVDSYEKKPVPDKHIDLLENAPYYFLLDENKLFVHAGINPGLHLIEQSEHTLLWDRDFYNQVTANIIDAEDIRFTDFDEVYIGHSPIHRIGFFEPKQIGEVWLMDTGAAWNGTLSMMNIDTKETYISEKPIEMYPEGSGRN